MDTGNLTPERSDHGVQPPPLIKWKPILSADVITHGGLVDRPLELADRG